ncbi:aspartate/glutamate racemase family protein [Salinicola avicenniae]|uniref:aspartate/glutamate racemase family protein n=1 Tax=Salinicola avicenniae TaxID=2916836 RepID=UPI002073FF6B|nr:MULTISPECIES: aspartate/glutamate racemase family protein [unclassified Salinicola]
MLKTRFPRPPGDIGNPASFAHEVRYATVHSASVPAIVSARIDEAIVDDFVAAGQQLVARGAEMIATSCGFVCAIHDRLQARLSVPLVSSSLNLVPSLAERFGGASALGIMTFDAGTLGESHFGRFWRPGTVIQGLEASEVFYPTIRHDRDTWAPARVEAEVVTAAQALQRRAPNMRALLLECTNLSPYRQRLGECLGVPIYDIHTAIEHGWRHGGFQVV